MLNKRDTIVIQRTLVYNARIELYSDRSADDLTQETARILGITTGFGYWTLAVGGHWC